MPKLRFLFHDPSAATTATTATFATRSISRSSGGGANTRGFHSLARAAPVSGLLSLGGLDLSGLDLSCALLQSNESNMGRWIGARAAPVSLLP